jgi:cytochrome c oxidase cbb3-type subunit I/II
MDDPRSTTPQSLMPRYSWMLEKPLDFASIQARVDAMAMLGVPYGAAIHSAEVMARAQAKQVAAEIVTQGGPAGLEDKEIVALIAYLQRLGTDIKKQPAQPPSPPSELKAAGASESTLTSTSGSTP